MRVMWGPGEGCGGNNSTVKRESAQGGRISKQSQGRCKKRRSGCEHYFTIRRCRMGLWGKVARKKKCFDYTLVEDEPDARTARDSGIDLA